MKISFLAKKRTEQGLFVQEVAQKLGVSADEVRRWEEEGELPDAEYLLPLADLYGVSVEEILRAAEDEAPPAMESAGGAEIITPASEDGAAEGKEPPAGVNANVAEGTAAENLPAAQSVAAEDAPALADKAEREYADFSQTARQNTAKKTAGKAKRAPKTESYYQKLNRKLAEKYPPGSIPPDENTLYGNGYMRGERIFGYVVWAVFLLVLLIELFVWLGREREITAENYREFISIDVRATESVNPDDYALYVTAERDLLNISVTVSVRFAEIGDFFGGETETFEQTVTLSYGALKKNQRVSTDFHVSAMAFERGFEVLSVSGRSA